MINLLISILIIIAVSLFYRCYIKPKKMMKNYARFFRQKGYKVLEEPFFLIRQNMYHQISKGMAQGDAFKVLKEVYAEYDVIVSNFFWNPEIQVNHPRLVKGYFQLEKHLDFPKIYRIGQVFSRVAGIGLPFSEGEVWKRKRNILNKVFNFDFVKQQSEKIACICDDTLQQLQSQSKINKNEVTYEILNFTVQVFSKVILTSFLGGKSDESINGEPAGKFLKKLMNDVMLESYKPLNIILGSKYQSLGITSKAREIMNRIKVYRQWGNEFIKKRINQINQDLNQQKETKQAPNIIKALIIAQRKAKTNNQNNDEDTIKEESEIFDQFSNFFVAGTDTTSNYAQMMIYQICLNPKIETRVRQEIKTHMQDNNYSYENLKKLTYIDCIQKQVTRYFGPAINLFPRQTKVDSFIDGIPIRKGTTFIVDNIANHYNEKYFQNPHQFKPQRWENQCLNLEEPYTFGGFSAGARSCIGKQLAMLESKIALIKFMKRYSKITLGNPDFKMVIKFLYGPEDFESTMVIGELPQQKKEKNDE